MSEWAPAVELRDVGFAYRQGRRGRGPDVLRGCSVSVPRGSVFAVLGPNGRGKTTLLKLMLGVLKADQGTVDLVGQTAFVPQLFQVTFPYRVLDMVVMGRARSIGLFSTPSPSDVAAAYGALDRLGLSALAHRSFDELSGGQRQLVISARALASGADVLVLDEPASALDLKNQAMVLEWIARLARVDGLTVVLTTHHPQHALAVADRSLLMFGPDDVVCGSSDQVLSEANLQRLYGVPLRRIRFEERGRMIDAVVPLLTR